MVLVFERDLYTKIMMLKWCKMTFFIVSLQSEKSQSD